MSDNKKSGFSDLGKGVADVGRAAVGVAATGASVIGTAGRAGGGIANKTAGFAGSMLSGVAKFATAHPKVTFLVGLYAGLKGVQSLVHKSKEKKAAAEAFNAAEAPQAEVYSPQAFSPVQAAAPMAMGAPSEETFRPMESAAAAIPAEQQQALREMLQAQAAQEAPAASMAAPQQSAGWAQQIEQKRQQQAQGPQQHGM